MAGPFYTINAQTHGADDHAEILIYSEIGDSWFADTVDAKSFVDQIGALDVSNISVRINSPGGSVFDGHAIHNALKRHRAHVTTYVDGLAASIASVVALAGDRVVMAQNSVMMIHNAWTVAIGDANEMRSKADVLDTLNRTLVGVYESKTSKPREEIVAAMSAETWFDAASALEFGLADEITKDEAQIAALAQFDVKALERFRRTPERLVAALREPTDEVFCTDTKLQEVDPEQLARVNKMLFS